MSKTYYNVDTWNLLCDRCGKKIKASSAKHEWTGLLVCPPCFEHRHSHDFIKTKVDKQYVPYSRHEATDTFISVSYILPLSCTYLGMSGISGIGVSGCSITNKGMP